jgi:hypothetical protein
MITCFNDLLLNRCPYTHASYIPETEKKEVCRDFQRGTCPRGERSCPFIHVAAGPGAMMGGMGGRDLGSPPRRMGGYSSSYSPPHSSPISTRGGGGGGYPLPLPSPNIGIADSATLKVHCFLIEWSYAACLVGPLSSTHMRMYCDTAEWTRWTGSLPRLLVQKEVRRATNSSIDSQHT